VYLKILPRLSSGSIEITKQFSQGNRDPDEDFNVFPDTGTRFDLTSVPVSCAVYLKNNDTEWIKRSQCDEEQIMTH
jgi:hypothetical protein